MIGAGGVTAAPSIEWRRVALLTVIGLCGLFIVRGLSQLAAVPHAVGSDMALYQHAAQRWLAGGSFYEPYQLAGPYVPDTTPGLLDGAILYPPVALALLVPASYLPAILWYAVPLAVTAWIVGHHRPRLTAWAGIALCAAAVPSIANAVAGNPTLWIMAIVAVSTVWRPAGALVLLKPSVFPFALVGVRDRWWWVIAAVMVGVSVALLPMTLDWMRAVLNASGDRSGIFYSLRDVPMLLLPLVARWGATNG